MQTRGLFSFAAGLPLLFQLLAGLTAIQAGPSARLPAAFRLGDPDPQRVTIQTEDKATLVATYYPARETAAKAPAAVLVHGAGGSRADLQLLALRLQKSGFAALTIDLRGHGESATDQLDWKKLDGEKRLSIWAGMPRDVQAGVGFLLDQKGVYSTGVSLVGDGAGCALVARLATRDERVRDVVLVSPQTDELGSTLSKDLIEIAGLPIFIGAGKDQSETAKRLAEISTLAAGSAESVEVNVSKVGAAELLGDNKFSGDVARWMKAKALPGAALQPTDLERGR